MRSSLGIDYGTNSVRALIVDCSNGTELGSCVVDYPSGHQGVLLDRNNHHLARQNPADYLWASRKAFVVRSSRRTRPDSRRRRSLGSA